MLNSLSSSCLQLQPFHRNSPLKCAPQPKITKKTLKPPTDVNIAKKLVTSACYDRQHVYAYLQLFSC